jgi:hypothetical protein
MPIPAPPPGTYAENGTGRVAQPTSHTPNSTPAVPAAAPKAKAPAITYVEFGHDRKEQEGCQDHQVHGALEHRGAPGG